ncbi:class I adenylate-forming enzyme family protein [Streptomyces sp. S4.7]|uniref:class I adenylate-forming enzyme family protein n=1 Tax=Streptomyces sp. S4.7 TaxID=2705439 RepID=UPI0013D94A30|nr:class I adenylate-forming enzyme family protein [Streptomyces sp. S4.7]
MAHRRPDAIAVRTANGEAVTYQELLAHVDRMAEGLAARQVGRGDVVACRGLRNSTGYVAFILAVAKTGAVYVPLIREFDREGLDEAIRRTRPMFVVTEDEHHLVSPTVDSVALKELESAGPPPVSSPAERDAVDGPFRILWSSGSTGFPKMISWRQDKLLQERKRWVRHIGLTDTDVVFCGHTLDVAHATDLHLFAALLAGAPLVLGEPESEPERLLGELEGTGATMMSALPRHYAQLADAADTQKDAERPTLSALRLPLCGGTYVGSNLVARCRRSLGIVLCEIYGSTEFGLAAVDLPSAPAVSRHLPLVTGVEARLEPIAGAGRDEAGELVLSSPWTSEGYLHSEVAHLRTFRDGEYWTGDVAQRDDSGRYRILGRVSESLPATHGLLFTPGLDEDLVAHCPVAEAVSVVADLDDPDVRVHVVVRPAPGRAAEEVRAEVRARLVGHHGLTGDVVVTDTIPRTAVGKPNKALIRSRAGADQ